MLLLLTVEGIFVLNNYDLNIDEKKFPIETLGLNSLLNALDIIVLKYIFILINFHVFYIGKNQ